MELESAMADVRKVVDFATPEGLGQLQAQLEALSRTIPLTASQLADIAAAGGQLGIAAPDLPDYTETVAKAATAFDMIPQEAGLAMAKLANVYSIPVHEIGTLGDAINQLSNNAAASAPEIVDALTRAGNAARFGLAAKETAAYATAMIALGETPERAGTALNFLLQRLQTATRQTPKFQEALAEIGYTAEQLERAVAEGPNAALMALIETLGQLDAQAGMGVLTGLVGTEHSAKIAKLVGNIDETRRVMGLVANESAYAGSMQAEFAARADTTANRLQLLANRVDELKRALGSALLPVIEQLSNRLTPLLQRIQTWIAANPALASNITLAVAALGAMGVVLGPIIMGVGMLVGGMGLLAGGLGAVTATLGTLGGALGAIKLGGLAASFRGMAAGVMMTPGPLSKVLLVLRGIGAALISTPVGLFVAALVGAALLVRKYWEPIKGFLGGMWDGLTEGLAPVGAALREAFAPLAPLLAPVEAAIRGLIDWLGRLLEPVRGTGAAAEAMGRKFGEAVAAAIRAAGRILAAFANLPSQMLQIGINIIGGLLSGMRQKWAELKEWAAGVAGSVASIFRRETETRSPSRVFMGIGEDLMRGLQIGIDRVSVKPLSAVRTVAAAVTAIPMAATANVPQGVVETYRPPAAITAPRRATPARVDMPITINISAPAGADSHELAALIEARVREATGEAARHISALYDDPDEV
jgi:TP901 family phage tail tape measure protein